MKDTLSCGLARNLRRCWGDGHVRGVDLFTVRDGNVAAKLSYVMG